MKTFFQKKSCVSYRMVIFLSQIWLLPSRRMKISPVLQENLWIFPIKHLSLKETLLPDMVVLKE